jgi:hypothetical protein
MLSEIISKVAVYLVGLLIFGAIWISGIFLTLNYCDKIEKILIKKNTPKWVVSTLTSFFGFGGVLIFAFLGAMTVDYLGLDMYDPIGYVMNLLRDFLHILSSFFY